MDCDKGAGKQSDAKRAAELGKQAQAILKKKGGPPGESEQQAAHLFSEAITLCPKAALYFGRGKCFLQLSQYQRALFDFSMAIRLESCAKHFGMRAWCYRKLGRLNEAQRDYAEALRLEKDNPTFHFERALVYFDLGDFQEAQQGCQQAVELKPPDKPALTPERMAKAFLYRGICFRKLGELEQSENMLKQALAAEIDAETHNHLGLTYLAMGNHVAAKQCFTHSLEFEELAKYLNNRGLASYHLKQLGDSIADFTSALEMGEDATVSFNRGNAYFSQDDFASALLDYEEAIRLAPTSVHYHHVGLAHQGLKNVSQAIESFLKAISIEDYVPSLLHLGIMYHMDGQFQKALDVFNTPAIPADQTLLERRGLVYRDMEKYVFALQDFDKAIEKKECGKFYYYRGNVCLRKEDFNAAISDFDRALELGLDEIGECLNDRGLACRALGNLAQACDDLTKACERSTSSEVWCNRAQCWFEQGLYDRADADLCKALTYDNTDPQIYYKRGITRYAQRQYAEAVVDLKEALDLDAYASSVPDIYYHLGLAYSNIGKHPLALPAFNEALQREPDKVHYLHERAKSLQIVGEHEQALTDFTKVLVLQPTNSRAHFRRGFSYKALKMYEEAAEDFEAAKELDPNDPRYVLNYRKLHGVHAISLGPAGLEDPVIYSP